MKSVILFDKKENQQYKMIIIKIITCINLVSLIPPDRNVHIRRLTKALKYIHLNIAQSAYKSIKKYKNLNIAQTFDVLIQIHKTTLNFLFYLVALHFQILTYISIQVICHMIL